MKVINILILFFVCYVPLLVFFSITPYITRRTESFGVSIPEDVFDSQEVKNIRNSYRNNVLIFGTVLAIFTFINALLGSTSAIQIFIPVGVFIQLATMFVFYLLGHHKMKALKAKSNWTYNKPQAVVVDTGFRTRKIMVSPMWFMLYALAIFATAGLGVLMYDKMPQQIPMKYDLNGNIIRYMQKSYKVLFIAPVLQLFITFLMGFVYWSFAKARQEIDPSNPEKSIEQNTIFRYRWSAFIVFMGLLLLGLFGFMQFTFTGFIKDPRLVVPVPMVLTLLIVVGAVILSITTGQGGSRVRIAKGSKGEVIRRDDDKYWKLGMFYYNPDDPAIFVEKRFGVGFTNNFARPASWLMLIGILVIFPAVFIVIISLLSK